MRGQLELPIGDEPVGPKCARWLPSPVRATVGIPAADDDRAEWAAWYSECTVSGCVCASFAELLSRSMEREAAGSNDAC